MGPKDGAVAASGDLGLYLWYLRPSCPTSGIRSSMEPRKVSGKKEKGGRWKYVLGTGNQGIGNLEEKKRIGSQKC